VRCAPWHARNRYHAWWGYSNAIERGMMGERRDGPSSDRSQVQGLGQLRLDRSGVFRQLAPLQAVGLHWLHG